MKRMFFIGVVLTGILFSCQDKIPSDEEQLKAANADGSNEVACLEMIYPFTYIMPDGSTITGNDKGEMDTALKKWYRVNPGSKERPSLQYPVEIIFRGNPMTINTVEEMKRVKQTCKRERRSCFEFIYPVTYIMPDGIEITITGKDDKEGWMKMKTWYEANPDTKEKPSLEYPVEIKYKDGSIKTIHTKEEMRMARTDCK